MVNINRGEYDLTVEGNVYTLVLTLDDLINLENGLDMGGDEFFQKVRAGNVRVMHVNMVLTRALGKGKPRLSRKEIEALLPDIPYPDRKMAVMMLVAGALNYLNEQQLEEMDADEGGEKEETKDPLSATVDSIGENS